MKRITVIKTMASLLALLIMLTSCSSKTSSQVPQKSTAKLSSKEPVTSNPANNNETKEPALILTPYTKIGDLLHRADLNEYIFEKNQYKPEDIYTYSYDSKMVFKGSEALASEILEKGKNPGLGIRDLHKQGITGKNVNVAIIDQDLLTDHPEFAGRIAAYYDSGCDTPQNIGSMHGPGVTSILAGKTIGVAPEVNVYYAVHKCEMDAKSYADCLNWIIQQNEKLPKSQKIRVVSVSSSPTDFKNPDLWIKAVTAAQKDGIFVITCNLNDNTGFVDSSYYNLADKDNILKGEPGYPDDTNKVYYSEQHSNVLFVPASFRTCAQEFTKGEYGYLYDGVGGRSWAIPYVSGVMALGWQVNPELSGETMKSLLFQTSWVNEKGFHFINPPAFIEAVRKAH